MDFVRTFNEFELERIRAEADRRIRNHPNTWSFDKPENRLRNERIGVASEWAVSEWLNVPEDPVFEDHGPGGDGGHEVTAADGRIVEVKATYHDDGRLIIPDYDKRVFNFAALCVGIIPCTVEARGYVTRQQFIDRHYLYDFGSGGRTVVDQKRLEDFGDLVSELAAIPPRTAVERW